MFCQSIGDVSTNNINSSAELPTMLYKLKILDHLFFLPMLSVSLTDVVESMERLFSSI